MILRHIAAAFALTAFGAAALPAPLAQAQESTKFSSSAYAESTGGNAYKSDYFDLSFKLPGEWVLASEKEAEKIMNIGTEMVAGSNEDMKRKMDASVRQSLPIMFASRYAMTANRPDNINVSSIAENVSAFPSVTRGSQYFDNMRLIAKQSATPMNFADDYGTRMIGGVSFDTMQAEIPLGSIVVKQEYYAARIGDHVVSFISTYLTDDDKFLLDGIISSIELD